MEVILVVNSELFARIADEQSHESRFAWPDEPAWIWISLDVSLFHIERRGW